MADNLISLYVQQYATNIALLLQQKGSKLRHTVMSNSYVGKQASPVDQIAPINMNPVTSRFAAMGRVDANTNRRWVFPNDYDLPQLIDSFDKLRLLTDPQSSYVQNAVFAAGRTIDNLIISAFNGTSYTGTSGSTQVAFPTATNQVAVNFGASASVGLTVAKLREARRLLMSYNLDLESEEIFCIVNSTQHDRLLAEAQIISSDFNAGAPVLKEGLVTRFLGMNIVHTELLANNGGTSDYVMVYAKSGMHLGIWNDIATNVSQRHDLQGLPWQSYVYLTAGATRIEENRCVQIACYNVTSPI